MTWHGDYSAVITVQYPLHIYWYCNFATEIKALETSSKCHFVRLPLSHITLVKITRFRMLFLFALFLDVMY